MADIQDEFFFEVRATDSRNENNFALYYLDTKKIYQVSRFYCALLRMLHPLNLKHTSQH